MDWLEKLKGLISANLHDIIKFESNRNSHDDNRKLEINTNGGNINFINVPTDANGKVDGQTLQQLKDVLLPAFENDEVIFLEDKSTELLKDYRSFNHDPQVVELLQFFTPVLNTTDLRLLETGLYEKHLLESGDFAKAQQIKKDVISVHGVRGKNILNLASGDYFSTHIRPLYEALAKESKEGEFPTEFENIVSNLPFTIFVHSGISPETALQLLHEKAGQNLQYGVSEETIILNGFGQNADTIQGLIPTLEQEYKRVAPSVKYLGSFKTIQVAVYYRETLTSG